MGRARGRVQERLEVLREACEARPGEEALPVLREALGDRHCLMAARAAEVAGERLLYGLEADLKAAYGRFLRDPIKQDPHCTAKAAIARALVALDCQDARFYLAGLVYRQLEPVYGGRQDSAVDLRCTCAMGLVGTAYPRAAADLAGLLADPEPRARMGAARALGCLPSSQAEPVLRLKALVGDEEPEVVGECLTALLQVEPEESVGFVAGFLGDPDAAVRELAALALGASRADGALEALRDAWGAPLVRPELRRVLLRAAVLHRSQAAFDWLVGVVAEADERTAVAAVEEIALYRHNERLRERLAEVVAGRGRVLLTRAFEEAWGKE
jgi:HEAT repeat protein